MTIRLLSGKPTIGRALRRARLSRVRTSHDRDRHTSDDVWALLEGVLAGDADAALVMDDLIEEGVSSGSTHFVKITRKARKLYGRVTPAEVVPNAYAAITPGRQIVLFGMNKKKWKAGDPPGGVMRGYVRRFKIGDEAEHGSYNLVYTGPVTKITLKTVAVSRKDIGDSRGRVFDIESFSDRNWDFDVEAAAKQNRGWSD
jgi:hypothetical protein